MKSAGSKKWSLISSPERVSGYLNKMIKRGRKQAKRWRTEDDKFIY